MEPTDLDAELAALPALGRARAAPALASLTGTAAPKASAALLRLALAYELQARAHGHLSNRSSERLARASARACADTPPPRKRLVREWKGRLHTVIIESDETIRWDGRTWNSLERSCPRDHRHPLVGSGLLRPFAEATEAGMTAGLKPVRCAIYTRKSSEEGLEQGFNSLDAQREACAAYIKSQANEGWELLDTAYDDGGISGGTLERPGLQALLADVAAGKVDIIVVYKVDRLTRSLLDFAKLVEALDKAGTSFVSITQAFNTTTSMGRLTLNMLLSFAQFEREVTAERIRDKIAASKAKGMWMGGIPPLGYRPNERSLAIVEHHAALVRTIYARYLELDNVCALAKAFAAEGVAVPRRTDPNRQAARRRSVYPRPAVRHSQQPSLCRRHSAQRHAPHGATSADHHARPVEHRPAAPCRQPAGRERRRRGRRSVLAGLIYDEPASRCSRRTRPRARRAIATTSAGGATSAKRARARSACASPHCRWSRPWPLRLSTCSQTLMALVQKAGIVLTSTDLEPLAACSAAAAKEMRNDDGWLVATLLREVQVLPSGLSITYQRSCACRVPAAAGRCGASPQSSHPHHQDTIYPDRPRGSPRERQRRTTKISWSRQVAHPPCCQGTKLVGEHRSR